MTFKKSSPKKNSKAVQKRNTTKPKLTKDSAPTNEAKQVRFSDPLKTNQKKSVSEYNIAEMLDIYQRYVEMEIVDDKTKRRKMSLHQIFQVLFDCNEAWMENYLEARIGEQC
ncbi:hypothetical protein JTE90_016729 [Oedothorax gibbosus]|uniref:Transposase n=1 Tax=Oedothorax gibbosus TaxID=931172 RepID=A0AAV6TUW3_9ARAC|nr:hypothetical protein JTE90_016729 [Oedothorax gibbosus]